MKASDQLLITLVIVAMIALLPPYVVGGAAIGAAVYVWMKNRKSKTTAAVGEHPPQHPNCRCTLGGPTADRRANLRVVK